MTADEGHDHLRPRPFDGCLRLRLRWRVRVGELEVDRVGALLDLGREGRGASIAVAGGDQALGCRFGFCDELRGEFRIVFSRLFLEVCLWPWRESLPWTLMVTLYLPACAPSSLPPVERVYEPLVIMPVAPKFFVKSSETKLISPFSSGLPL